MLTFGRHRRPGRPDPSCVRTRGSPAHRALPDVVHRTRGRSGPPKRSLRESLPAPDDLLRTARMVGTKVPISRDVVGLASQQRSVRRPATRIAVSRGRTVSLSGTVGGHDGPVTIRVFLLDDHEIVRRGVRELLETDGEIEVVGEAGTAERGASPGSPSACPTSPCSTSGSPTVRRRGVPRDPLVAPRDRLPDAHVVRRRRGAARQRSWPAPSGYVLKQVRGNDIVDAMRRVAAGESLLDPASSTEALERLRRGPTRTSAPGVADRRRSAASSTCSPTG